MLLQLTIGYKITTVPALQRPPRREAALDLAATMGVPAANFFPPALRGVFSFLSLTSTSDAPEAEAPEAEGLDSAASTFAGAMVLVDGDRDSASFSSSAETAEVLRTRVPKGERQHYKLGC